MNFAKRHVKKISLLACLIYGVLMSGQIFAAQECHITLSESNMDFGRVTQPGSNDPRSANNMHALGNRVISVNASCPQAAKLVLQVQGAALGEQFRFARQGQVGVYLSNALLDGRSVDLAKSQSIGAAPGASAASIMATPGDRVIPVSGGLPATGSVLSLQVEIRPLVAMAELRTRDAKTLEANLSFRISSY